MFHLEKTLIITSPWSPPTFLFLLEQVPADPCPSGNHEGRTITDITLLSTIFLLETCRPPQTGPIPHENPGSSQGIWVRRLYIQDNCIFPAAPHSQGRDHMEPPLSSGVTVSFLTCWTLSLPEGRLTTSWGLENLLSVEGLLTGWENKLSSRNPNLSPGVFVWRTLVLSGDLFFSWPVSPGV